MKPFFSIIIPVYNCEKTIKQTLDSVLNQTFDDYELIIIDDCSKDESLNVINEYSNKFKDIKIIINNQNLGVANSRNIGFRIAKGDFVALLDSDDLWKQDKLAKQKLILENTGCDICCTSYNFIDADSKNIKKTYKVPSHINYNMLLKENYIGCSSVVIKRSILINNYMKSNFSHEDYALWLELARKGHEIIGIDEPLMNYRILNSSRSYNKIKSAKGRMTIYMNQEKFSVVKSLYYLLHYAFNGVMKRFL